MIKKRFMPLEKMHRTTTSLAEQANWKQGLLLSRTPFLKNLSLLLIAALACSSQAAEVDAGSLQQQIDRQQRPKLPPVAQPLSAPKNDAVLPATGPLVTLQAFKFEGPSKLSEKELSALLAPYLGKSLSFAQLQAATIQVADAYRDAGWIAKAFLPEQDIVDGIVRLQIVEAVFGEVLVNNPLPGAASTEKLKKIVLAQQGSGQLLNAKAVDRALLIADDISGAYISGGMQEGQKDGQTDLLLKLQGKPVYQGALTSDNTGSVATGQARFLGNVNVHNVLFSGDSLSTQLLSTEGSKYIRLASSVPVGYGGMRWGISASKLSYKVLQLEADLAATGTSHTWGLESTYPIVRSRLQNLYLNAGLDAKKFRNIGGGEVTTAYKNKAMTLGLSGNLLDTLGGGGANSANLTLTLGDLNLDGSPNAEEVAITTQTAGRYRKLRYALSRQQTLSREVSLMASVSGQWANKNLDSSEKFYLGGSSGVRAYPSSEGGGALGNLASLELRWQATPATAWTGFVDIGRVVVNRNNQFTGAPATNEVALKGAGIAFNWQVQNNLAVKTVWARRRGTNPNASVEVDKLGTDTDGTKVMNRFWISANLDF
jgi:hemolysin activation/secretion protein